jgi:ABC-type Fe3+ transport system permease subunit
MKRILQKLVPVLAVLALLFVAAPQLHAQNTVAVCRGVAAAGGSCSEDGAETTVNDIIGLVVNILSIVVGIVAVVMIIIAGFKYITSSGDASNVQSAKNTILYAIVGLVIVAMAQMITGFVLDRVAGD